MEQHEHERELIMLAGIAGILHWFEELLNIVNGPVLLAGMFIALIDLLTDGKLTATEPILLFVWAGSQALGIDGQLLGAWSRVSRARGWKLFGWLIVGIVLGIAAWQAGYVFAVQQSQGISETAALAQLNMPVQAWLGWRMFLAVALIALHAITRYRKPAKAKAPLEEERAEIERELTLEPLRQRLRAQQVGGLRALAETALRGASEPQHPPLPAPTTPLGYRSGYAPSPVQFGRPDDDDPSGPDDDGPGSGVSLPDDLADTGPWPAINSAAASADGSGRLVGRAQADDDPATSSGRRKQPRLSREDRERLKAARQEERRVIIREMLAANPDVKVNAIYEELRKRKLGTNVNNIKLLMGSLRRERVRTVWAAQG